MSPTSVFEPIEGPATGLAPKQETFEQGPGGSVLQGVIANAMVPVTSQTQGDPKETPSDSSDTPAPTGVPSGQYL